VEVIVDVIVSAGIILMTVARMDVLILVHPQMIAHVNETAQRKGRPLPQIVTGTLTEVEAEIALLTDHRIAVTLDAGIVEEEDTWLLTVPLHGTMSHVDRDLVRETN
jgi:hypothetical protein